MGHSAAVAISETNEEAKGTTIHSHEAPNKEKIGNAPTSVANQVTTIAKTESLVVLETSECILMTTKDI